VCFQAWRRLRSLCHLRAVRLLKDGLLEPAPASRRRARAATQRGGARPLHDPADSARGSSRPLQGLHGLWHASTVRSMNFAGPARCSDRLLLDLHWSARSTRPRRLAPRARKTSPPAPSPIAPPPTGRGGTEGRPCVLASSHESSCVVVTSVVSYLTARPSRDVVAAGHQQTSLDWWEHRRKDFDLVASLLVLNESRLGDPLGDPQ